MEAFEAIKQITLKYAPHNNRIGELARSLLQQMG